MYYTVKVEVATDTPKGVKYVKETYLVEAESVSDAEMQTEKDFAKNSPGLEFEVSGASQSRIVKVIK